MPNKQIIFCVETTNKNLSDRNYIDAVVKHFFKVGNNKLSYVYMGGKSNYNKTNIIEDINKHIKKYAMSNAKNQSFVFYCFDKDNHITDFRDQNFSEEVKAYCKQNKYGLIWFVKTIEEVMHSKTIRQRYKKSYAEDFLKNHRVESLKIENLKCKRNTNKPGKSNIISAVEQVLDLKDDYQS